MFFCTISIYLLVPVLFGSIKSLNNQIPFHTGKTYCDCFIFKCYKEYIYTCSSSMTTYSTYTYICIRWKIRCRCYQTKIKQCEHMFHRKFSNKGHVNRICDSTVLRNHSLAHRSTPSCAVINPMFCSIITALRYNKCILRHDNSWCCRSLPVY